MRDRKRKTAFFDLDFSSEEKSYFMRSDFDDFRAAFFDLPFSIATSYRNGGDFRSEKMMIENYCATRYQGVCMAHSQKPRENTRDTATYTPEDAGSDHEGTQEHSKAW